MKILESQAAVLSNWEVYEHLTEQKERYKKTKHRGPQNFEDLVRYVGHSPVFASVQMCRLKFKEK